MGEAGTVKIRKYNDKFEFVCEASDMPVGRTVVFNTVDRRILRAVVSYTNEELINNHGIFNHDIDEEHFTYQVRRVK